MRGGEFMRRVIDFILDVIVQVLGNYLYKWLETSPSALGDPPRSGQAKLDR